MEDGLSVGLSVCAITANCANRKTENRNIADGLSV